MGAPESEKYILQIVSLLNDINQKAYGTNIEPQTLQNTSKSLVTMVDDIKNKLEKEQHETKEALQKLERSSVIIQTPPEDEVIVVKTLPPILPSSVAATKRLYDKSWWSSPGLALARESLYQIKILLGKNYKVKTYNQLHKNDKTKDFKARQRW